MPPAPSLLAPPGPTRSPGDGGGPFLLSSAPSPWDRPPLRIALLNVKYSPNLGDGLLAECLERELAEALGNAEVFSIDLAGREGWDDGVADGDDGHGDGNNRRARRLALLERLPGPLRQVVAASALTAFSAFTLRPHVRRALAGCDAAVIGGGNLLTDADLNFPIKLLGATREVMRRRLPLAVHAVGAGAHWSRPARRRFASLLGAAPLAHATVRDDRSRVAWMAQLGPRGIAPAAVAGDPGLLAGRHYPAPAPQHDLNPRPSHARRIGLCITAPLALRYHVGQSGDGASRPPDDATLLAWYGKLASALARQGHQVVLFTNGSPEDRECLSRHAARWTGQGPAADWLGGLAGQIGQVGGRISVAAPFALPADLARFVASCDLVIAHRMHACIAAHAFAVPTIGLTWDEKLTSFFAQSGRARYAVDGPSLPLVAMLDLVHVALIEGVDQTALDAQVACTRADVALLAGRLQHVIQSRRVGLR